MSSEPEIAPFAAAVYHPDSGDRMALLKFVEQLQRDEYGRMDLPAMARRLEELGDEPTLVVVNAGEVNAGEFDPVLEMIDLARKHRCWVHVDGAFGLFAVLYAPLLAKPRANQAR